MITYQTRDITKVKMGIVCHGVNCRGKMGSGVALAIRNKWPMVYESYSKGPTGQNALGRCDMVNVDESVHEKLFVANCYTQLNYGSNGAKYADVYAIRRSLSEAYKWANYYHHNIFIPKIGCGLGGLDWDKEVLPIIEELDDSYDDVSTIVCSL